jgi:hypothetical protein
LQDSGYVRDKADHRMTADVLGIGLIYVEDN